MPFAEHQMVRLTPLLIPSEARNTWSCVSLGSCRLVERMTFLNGGGKDRFDFAKYQRVSARP